MRIIRALTRATSMLIACAIASGAQEHRPYRPAFDVRDYALTIDLPDTGSTIHGLATLALTITRSADSLLLDLLDLRWYAVTGDG